MASVRRCFLLAVLLAASVSAAHPARLRQQRRSRPAIAFVQGKGVFDDAGDLAAPTEENTIVGAATNQRIVGVDGAFKEDAPTVSQPRTALAAQLSQVIIPKSPPKPVMPLVEARPPEVDTQEAPPPENDASGSRSNADANDLLSPSADEVPGDAGEHEAVTFEAEVQDGVRPPTPPPAAPADASAAEPTTAPAHALPVRARAAVRTAHSAEEEGTDDEEEEDVDDGEEEEAEAPKAAPSAPAPRPGPWRAADWGANPASLQPRERAMVALAHSRGRVRQGPPATVIPDGSPVLFWGKDGPPRDPRFGPPVAYINRLVPDPAKADQPLSPSVIEKPKGWDQCLRFTRDIKGRVVKGQELVKVWTNTCKPAVESNLASQRFNLMCNSIGGALDPFTAQIDYKPEDVCLAVLTIFHDVNAVDSKPGGI